MSHTDSGDRSGRSARASGGDLQGAAPKPRRGGPPPLAWLVIGLLLVIGAITFLTTRGAREPVRPGPSMPTAQGDEANAVVDPATAPPPARTTGPSGGPAAPVTPTE